MSEEIYWEFRIPDENFESDEQYSTKEAAQRGAEEYCLEMLFSEGKATIIDIDLALYNDGDLVRLEPATAEYDDYNWDYEEHNIIHFGGVL